LAHEKNDMKTTSSKLLTASIVVTPIALFTENWVPDFYYNNGPILIYCQPLWWLSTLLLVAAIITKKLRNETPYPFSKILILFFIQVFFGFHPLTPLPFILILAFTGFYQFYILKKSSSNTPVDSDAA
jgi:uncharacterized membrane protein YhaH (DUF805 family)